MAQRVLVVDDDLDLLDLLTDILRSFSKSFSRTPLDVTRASDGQAAVDALKRERFDLILLDIRMPGMDGIETLRQIKAIAPRVPVLMVTGSDSSSASEALRMGAFGYLPKPMDLRYVEHIVSLALGTSQAPVHA